MSSILLLIPHVPIKYCAAEGPCRRAATKEDVPDLIGKTGTMMVQRQIRLELPGGSTTYAAAAESLEKVPPPVAPPKEMVTIFPAAWHV